MFQGCSWVVPGCSGGVPGFTDTPANVLGLDLVLGLSMIRRCSLNRSFERRLGSPIYVL